MKKEKYLSAQISVISIEDFDVISTSTPYDKPSINDDAWA